MRPWEKIHDLLEGPGEALNVPVPPDPAVSAFTALPLGGFVRVSRGGGGGATALAPLQLSALGLDIIQGVLLSQADVGTEGFSEPLTEKRCLPTGRCFQKQKAAVDGGKRVKESLPLCLPHSSLLLEQYHVTDKLRFLVF